MATVSVCIVTYNSAIHIHDCLEAIIRQTQTITSIVIVDNASKDGSADEAADFDSGTVPILLIRNSVNNGFAGGQNLAIGATDSDYVLVLNPDVRLEPTYIELLIDAMEGNPRIGSATGQLLFAHDPSIVDSTGLVLGFARQAEDRGAGDQAAKWETAGDVFGVSGAASMYARRMIDDISHEGEFFDEIFFAYKEDVDVSWRARRLGWTSYYEPNAKALHARGWKKGGRKDIPLFVRQHSYMNRFYTLIKNEPIGWHWICLLPSIMAVEAAKLGYLVIKEPDILRCLPQLLRTVPSMLRKREMIAAQARERGVSWRVHTN